MGNCGLYRLHTKGPVEITNCFAECQRRSVVEKGRTRQ